jgi:hypothetical protein
VSDGPWITIKNWHKYAPTRRNKASVMPWIKLYRKLLEDRDYRKIPPEFRALLVDLWLVGSENDGRIRFDPPELAWRLRADESWLMAGLKAIAAIGFIDLGIQVVDELSTTGTQGDDKSYAERRGEERRGEREERILVPKADKPVSRDEPETFPRWWSLYPRRAGGNSRREALRHYRARLTDGVSAEVLEQKVREYAAFCDATDRTGTSYVQMAATWLNGREGWLQDWTPPADEAGTAISGVSGPSDDEIYVPRKGR